MSRTKKRPMSRPLINAILILFFALAMYDSGRMTYLLYNKTDTIHAAMAGAYFLGALIAAVALLRDRHGIWLWLLITILLVCGLAYLSAIMAKTWIIGMGVMLFFWIRGNNRKWHGVKW